jgi:hypothetical protein
MNLNTSPTIAQLQALTQSADDAAGNHILWVDMQGDVHLSLVPVHLSPNGFEDSQPTMRVRYETCGQGNGYVGPQAAADVSSMNRLLNSLVKEWVNLKPSASAQYVDSW